MLRGVLPAPAVKTEGGWLSWACRRAPASLQGCDHLHSPVLSVGPRVPSAPAPSPCRRPPISLDPNTCVIPAPSPAWGGGSGQGRRWRVQTAGPHPK